MKSTDVRWKRLLAKIAVWLVAEILLSFLGLDDMADYVEFMGERNLIVISYPG